MSRKLAVAVWSSVATLLVLNMLALLLNVAHADVMDFVHHSQSTTVSNEGRIEVAFSPNEGSEDLVIKAIKSAKPDGDIKVLSYSFTSFPIARALVEARHRGVAVTIVADAKENQGKSSRTALSALANVGADVRIISVFPIHHDNRNLT